MQSLLLPIYQAHRPPVGEPYSLGGVHTGDKQLFHLAVDGYGHDAEVSKRESSSPTGERA